MILNIGSCSPFVNTPNQFPWNQFTVICDGVLPWYYRWYHMLWSWYNMYHNAQPVLGLQYDYFAWYQYWWAGQWQPGEWRPVIRTVTHSWLLLLPFKYLNHWGWVMHICVGKLTIIGSDNGLSPGRHQAIIWTNARILLIGPLGTNFSEILIGIQTFSFKKMHLKMSSVKWRPYCFSNLVSDYMVLSFLH